MKHPLFTDADTLHSCVKLPHLPKSLPKNKICNENAFITGATGFIGGFLLKELLKSDSFQSYTCLVRANSKKEGLQRVKDNLRACGASDLSISDAKIAVVLGDILLPRFGIDHDSYRQLCASTDHFFHFAASMNWVLPFNKNTQANIEALKAAILFCSTERLKKLHYASSMGIWAILNHKDPKIEESRIHNQPEELPGGYFQSKWVNEKILQMASERGVPVNVYRIGDVKGDSLIGISDLKNFGNLFMRYIQERKIAIDSALPQLNYLPVDFLAKAIAHIAFTETGKTFQFSNPQLISISDIAKAVEDATGHQVALVSYSDWLAHLQNDKSSLGTTLKPIFRSFRPSSSSEETSFYEIGMKMFRMPHNYCNTDKALYDTGIQCPSMKSGNILPIYLAQLNRLSMPV